MQKAIQTADKTLSEQTRAKHPVLEKTYPQAIKKDSITGMSIAPQQPPYISCNPKKRPQMAKNSRHKKSKTKSPKKDNIPCRPQKSKDIQMQKIKTLSARQNTP